MQDKVLFLCAHNDDQIVGAGGTIAKYAKEGKYIATVIFSFGEASLPLIQEKLSKKTRVIESKRAARILGENEMFYLGLKETRFPEEIAEKNIHDKLARILRRIKPTKIFTHSIDDPHPDHRAVYRFTLDLVSKVNYKGELYTFNVWNLFLNIRKRDLPKLVVDITDTFKVKVEAFNIHKSQLLAKLSLMWNIYIQALWHGWNHHFKYAEVFYKER